MPSICALFQDATFCHCQTYTAGLSGGLLGLLGGLMWLLGGQLGLLGGQSGVWWSIGAVWRHTGAAQRASCYRVSAGTSSSPVVAASFSWECAEMGSAGLLTVCMLAATRRQAELKLRLLRYFKPFSRRPLMFAFSRNNIIYVCLLDCNL